MKNKVIGVFILVFAAMVLISVKVSINGHYLNFSDGAKYANIAKNVYLGNGYKTDFVFFNLDLLKQTLPITPVWVPKVVPLTVAAFFWLFGVSDLSVILASSSFYILLIVSTFFLGRRIFGRLVGFLAALSLVFNLNFLDYAASGATEPLFTLEIITALLLLSVGKKWQNICAIFIAFVMFFTKPQAVIYILGLLLFYLIKKYSIKRALLTFSIIFFSVSIFYLLLSEQGMFAISQNLPGISTSDSLRGGTSDLGMSVIAKKIFYNLYNFYRLIPQIVNPYIFGFFIINLFYWKGSKKYFAFKIASIFIILATFMATAITIPLFRYIHPAVPLIYLYGIETLVFVISKIYENFKESKIGFNDFRLNISKRLLIILCSSTLIFVFVVCQTLGVLVLDSRFERKAKNVSSPPVYAQLAWVLRDNTDSDDLVLTNLDTWGTWYGLRKTVWFPLKPHQLIDNKDAPIPFDAIYLTSYLIDDENYKMGTEWHQIFDHPNNPELWTCDGCEKLKKDFILRKIINFPKESNYENIDASAILLVKKIQ